MEGRKKKVPKMNFVLFAIDSENIIIMIFLQSFLFALLSSFGFGVIIKVFFIFCRLIN